jgi:hypothetical protein
MSWLYHTNSLGPRVDRRLHRWTLRSLRTARRQPAATTTAPNSFYNDVWTRLHPEAATDKRRDAENAKEGQGTNIKVPASKPTRLTPGPRKSPIVNPKHLAMRVPTKTLPSGPATVCRAEALLMSRTAVAGRCGFFPTPAAISSATISKNQVNNL